MKTNYLMLKELLKDFKPKQMGISTGEEVNKITEILHLSEMDALQLNNMRDFVVLFLGRSNPIDITKMDILSAITGVIDHMLLSKGEIV